MKKILILFSLIFIVLSLGACSFIPDGFGYGDGDEDGNGGDGSIWDGISYNFDTVVIIPDLGSKSPVTVNGRRDETRVTIELTAEKLKTGKEFANLRTKSNMVNYGTYLGLYNDPEGGVKCYDENGKGLGNYSDNGIYYARFDLEYKVEWEGIDDPAALGLPLTIKYGEYFNISKLPVMESEDENKRFVGWACRFADVVTDRYGNFLQQYALVGSQYKGVLKNVLHFYPSFEWKPVAVKFDFNDNTYRSETVEFLSSQKFDFENNLDAYPTSASSMREIAGWSIEKGGKENYDGEAKEGLVLYAIWRNYRYVTVYTDIGKSSIYKIYEGTTFAPPIPTKEGYTFAGWYPNEYATGMPLPNDITYGDPNDLYFAAWEKNTTN